MSDSEIPELGSLLPGRNSSPLNDRDIRRAINTFLGFEERISIKYDPDGATAFHVRVDENSDEYGEIIIGPDVYPGTDVTASNSLLSLEAVAAHEFTHYHRWNDKSELERGRLTHLDEALTSLDAISRYAKILSPNDVRQLASDAIKRIRLYISELGSETAP